MRRSLVLATELLQRAGYDTHFVESTTASAMLFEDDTVFGFLGGFADARELVTAWPHFAASVVGRYQFALRGAGKKAWNTYLVLLAEADASEEERVQLAQIEENLEATRKIVRAGCSTPAAVHDALITLLPIESEPRLDSVESKEEIRLRTTELDPAVLDAFFSHVDPSAALAAMGLAK